jgi:hypothetical protein
MLNRGLIIKIFLIVLFFTFQIINISCGPSQYRHYKKSMKARYYRGYKSNYQNKLKRNALPINKNYIIKNRRTSPAWR